MSVPKQHYTPRQLTWLCLGGSYAFVVAVPMAHLRFLAPVLSVALLLALIVLGAAVSFWAGRRIDRGIAADRWTQGQLTEGYLVLRNRWVSCAMLLIILLYLGYCLAWFTVPSNHMVRNTGFYVIFLQGPTFAMSFLRSRLKPSTPFRRASLIDLSNLPRLRSEHWGEPPASA